MLNKEFFNDLKNYTLEDLEYNLNKAINELELLENPKNQTGLWRISQQILLTHCTNLQLIINLMKTKKIDKFHF